MAAPWTAGAKLRIVGELHGQQTVNVIHFATNDQINDGPQLDQLLLQLAQAMADCIVEFLLPAVTIDWKFVRCEAQRVYPEPSDPVIVSGTPAQVGELGVASASFLASLVQVRTGGGGKRGRGRIYLPPAGEAQTTNSSLDEPTLVLLAAFLACVVAKFAGANPTTAWRIGVLSRKNLAGIIGNFDNSFREATQLSPVADVACMRSRRKGHGA